MNHNLKTWLWKWHFIGGLIVLPIILLLSVTGGIYLFKDTYEKPLFESIKEVTPAANRISYQEQWDIAKKNGDKDPTRMILPKSPNEATEFATGKFSTKSSIFINPYTANVTGKIKVNTTDMHKVQKLHGELLLGSFGTKFVELVASWMVVLLITGIIIFFPRERGWKGLFTIRTKLSRRVFFKDLHAVVGFWFSLMLLFVLAGGLPWTDVFGSGYKWVQDTTHSGYPETWKGEAFSSEIGEKPLSLDAMVKKAETLNLTGKVSIAFPKSETSVFSISNHTGQLSSRAMLHFDQYSGKLIHKDSWDDIGTMRKIRLWLMVFHVGKFGLWNWVLVLFTAIALFVLSIASLLSYLKRKQKGDWGVPEIPESFKINAFVIGVLVLLMIVLPLFGLSVALIVLLQKFKNRELQE